MYERNKKVSFVNIFSCNPATLARDMTILISNVPLEKCSEGFFQYNS